MEKGKVFKEALDYIAGSCMISPAMALEAVIGAFPETALIDEFDKYLAENECYKCETCGWYTHPGDGDGILCCYCLDDLEYLEDEEGSDS